MVRERYITENPFRLLGVGAALTQQQLRRKADSASRAATVGLKTDPPFDADFGGEDIEELSMRVRSLTNDPIRRLIYRFMWPLNEQAISYLTSNATPSANTLSLEEEVQLRFLSAWYGFLQGRSSEQAHEALDRWIDLYNDSGMDQRLKALIMEEEGLGEDEAYQRLIDAQEQLETYIAQRTVTIAAEEWENGNPRVATAIIEGLLGSSLEEIKQEAVLDPMIEIGQSLAGKVEELVLEIPEYARGASTEAPPDVVQLERLFSLLSSRHPIARGWGDIIETWYSVFGWKMRGAVLKLSQQGDDEGALSVVNEALKLVRDSKLRGRLLEDRTTLLEMVDRRKTFAGIKPISNAPGLATMNGIGIILLELDWFPADRRFRFANTYFSFFFIPIFPLARYLVEPVDRNRWRFLGTTKWTTGMKVHLAIACSLIVLGMALIANSGSSGTSTSGTSYGISPSNTPSVSSETASAASKSVTTPPNIQESSAAELDSQQRRIHLQSELETIKAKISTLDTEISSYDEALKVERSELESFGAQVDTMVINRESPQEVEDYNALVRSYEQKRSVFNTHVDRYNARLEERHKLVERHNEIVEELNKDR